MLTEGSDEMLMAAVAAGDQRSLRLLMDRHMKPVIRLAERVLLSTADADDVAQEAFLRVWKHAPRFEPERARFRTWLYRIVMNLALDRKPSRRAEPIEAAEYCASGEMDALDRLIDGERRQALEAAMIRLTDKQRAAIALFHLEGFSQREAAEALGLSEKAFESLVIRARRALKEIFDSGKRA